MTTFAFAIDVGGTDLELVLHGGRLTRGRVDPSNQCRAGYAALDQIDPDIELPRVPLNAAVRVTVTREGGTEVDLWAGHVTDRSDRIVRAGSERTVVGRRITAAGPLGIAPRRPVRDGGYVEQLDGERVRDALFDAFARPWLLATRTWAQIPVSVTWETWDPQLANSEIPDGTFTVAADTDASDPYAVIRKAATDANAVLYERADGRLLYATSAARAVQVALDGPSATLPSPLGEGLASTVALADAATEVRVGYVGGVATAEDVDTARSYQRVIVLELSTSLTESGDAQDLADALLDYRRNPRPTLRLRFPLAAYSTTDIDTLLGLELGDLVTMPNLPGIEHDEEGFIEQLEYVISRNAPDLVVTVSPVSAHLAALTWSSMPGVWLDNDDQWSTLS